MRVVAGPCHEFTEASKTIRRIMGALAVFLLTAAVDPITIGAPRATQTINIRDFGAKCDGQTDDYDAIDMALMRAGRQPGSTAYFPPSSRPCLLTRRIAVPADVTLLASPGSVTLMPTGANTSNPLLLQVASNVRVYGLSFDGGGRDYTNAANVILGYRVSGVTFDHIAVRHTRGIGLLLSSSIVDSMVRDSTFEDLGNHWKSTHQGGDRQQGVVFCCGHGNHGNAAINNLFSNIGLDALQFSDQTGVTITGNRFSLENGQRTLMSLKDYPAAIFTMRTDQATITKNVASGAQGNCIDAPGLTHATIANNALTQCGSAGVGLWDTGSYPGPLTATDSVQVSGNTITITNNDQWPNAPPLGGITLAGKATNVLISANIIIDTQQEKQQKYGVYGMPGATLRGLSVDASNHLGANQISKVGGTAYLQDKSAAHSR